MARDEFQSGVAGQRSVTGKLSAPRTSDLSLGGLGSGSGVDDLVISPGIRAEVGSAVDESAAKLLGDLYAEIARSKALLEDLSGPMMALRLALGLLAGNVPEAQLFAGCSAEEKDYVRALALHLVDATQYRQRVEVAVAQYGAASEQMAGLEKQIQEAAISAQTMGTEAFRELRLEKIRGMMHPLAMLHVTFEGDEMLSALVPPPRKAETRRLVMPESDQTAPPRKSLTDSLTELLSNPEQLGRFARRMVRKAVKALLYPQEPPGK